MSTLQVRQQIHKLIDEANKHQLNAVLEVLTPRESQYIQEEINSFYNRIKNFEESGTKGYSVTEAHTSERSRYNQKHAV